MKIQMVACGCESSGVDLPVFPVSHRLRLERPQLGRLSRLKGPDSRRGRLRELLGQALVDGRKKGDILLFWGGLSIIIRVCRELHGPRVGLSAIDLV